MARLALRLETVVATFLVGHTNRSIMDLLTDRVIPPSRLEILSLQGYSKGAAIQHMTGLIVYNTWKFR